MTEMDYFFAFNLAYLIPNSMYDIDFQQAEKLKFGIERCDSLKILSFSASFFNNLFSYKKSCILSNATNATSSNKVNQSETHAARRE